MVAITIIQPANGRPILTKIGQSSYNRQLTGVGRFNGTDASGTLIVPGLSQIAPGGIQLTPLQTLSQPTGSSFPIWYHLRHHHPYLHRPKDRNHQCRQLLHQGLITADDMNFWRFGILNKGTGNYVIAAPQIDSGASASATAKTFIGASDRRSWANVGGKSARLQPFQSKNGSSVFASTHCRNFRKYIAIIVSE